MTDVERHIADVDWHLVPGEAATIRFTDLLTLTSTVVGDWAASIRRRPSVALTVAGTTREKRSQ